MAGYTVVACARCGLCFADGVPPQAVFDAYYRDASKYENHEADGRQSDDDFERFGQSADFLVPYIASGDSRVLEVGCASGGLLAVLAARGQREVFGLDPSPACARAAARLHGIEVRTGTIFAGPAFERPFDVVILVGVLEHIRDVATAVKRARGLLAAGGLLCLEVPDAEAFTRSRDAPFQEFSIEHINYFTRASLDALLARHGFARVASTSQPRTARGGTVETATMVAAIYRAVGSPIEPDAPDLAGVAAVERYIARSTRREAPLVAAVSRVVARRAPIMVWGVGTLTQRLLVASALRDAEITAFLDSNVNVQGRTLRGVQIHPPAFARRRPEPILVGSLGHRDAIVRQIRAEISATCEVIALPDANDD